MCGICGKVYFDPQQIVRVQELSQMAGVLAHRGPDGEGVWTDLNAGLGHRRLAIIDLRAVADQPMCNQDGKLWITFNGEIYNFRELRAELELQGRFFRTNSDTEVILQAYEEYGRACLERLRGMFAFAIWDARARTLLLARDRLGKKPLFYYAGRDRFVFGSELKAILVDRSISIEPDPVALDHFLTFGYIPTPLTAFQGVQKLPAGHWLELHDGHIETGRYWKLHYRPKPRISMDEAITELRWRLAEAVRLRLVSDVSLGVFLSGGIDSSAIVAFMAQEMGHSIRTFSVGFEDVSFDERPYARQVAQLYGTEHTELVVKAPVTDILPRLVWHYDEPFGDSSAVPTYAIAEHTRQHVTVVLNGDGGDENFAGYDRYIMDRRVRRWDVIRPEIWGHGAATLRNLPAAWQQHQPLRKFTRIAAAMAMSPERRYVRWFGHFLSDERQNLYTSTFASHLANSDPEGRYAEAFQQSDADDCTDAALDADVNLYLADNLLVKMDRATMAHSLESRSPFLDHVLMEFVASLPSSFKLSGMRKKHLLRMMLQGLLPETVLNRPKMGFSVPLAKWFREDLKDMAHDLLLAPHAIQRGYFKADTVASLLRTHCRGEEDHAGKLWDLLVLELWHRTFIDREGGNNSSCATFQAR